MTVWTPNFSEAPHVICNLLLCPICAFVTVGKKTKTKLIKDNCFLWPVRLDLINFFSPSSITAEEGGVWLRHLIYRH